MAKMKKTAGRKFRRANKADKPVGVKAQRVRGVRRRALKSRGGRLMRAAATVIPGIKAFRSALEKIDSKVKLRRYKIRDFKPNVSYSFERGHFIVKTAENGADLEQCLKLRFEVFHREYMQKKRLIGVDVDKIDFICDHLMIIDKRTNQAIGTYRLNSSVYNNVFYSADEFNIDDLLKFNGNKLEIGRACIDRDHRTGTVLSLLWRGIFEYIRHTDTKMVFGCTSIKATEPLQIGLITRYITETSPVVDDAHITVTRKFRVKNIKQILDYLDHNPYEYRKEEIAPEIPALYLSYLNLGAKVASEPALDRDFGCIDFLTVLKMDELPAAVKGRYKI